MIVALAVALLWGVVSQAPGGTIAEIRIHGNYRTSDDEVRALVGPVIGQPATTERIEGVRQALLASGRFAGVDIRPRFLSLDDPTAIVLMVLIDEITPPADDLPVPLPAPIARVLSSSLWLPVVRYEDGYGVTYGARVSFVDAVGRGSRVSIPLTWGGERRAGVEVERPGIGPFTRLVGGAAIRRRENPAYELGDVRRTLSLRAERTLGASVRTGVHTAVDDLSFGDAEARQWLVGADATVDTRLDPTYPRNAVYVRGSWQQLQVDARSIARFGVATEGYVGVFRQVVMAVRAESRVANGALPRWEQELLGGASLLRGYRLGARVGDAMAAASAELRVPITSPLSVGKLGVRTFVDAGTTWFDGEAPSATRWGRGVGVGGFLAIAVFQAAIDVAWPERGGARWHVTLAARF